MQEFMLGICLSAACAIVGMIVGLWGMNGGFDKEYGIVALAIFIISAAFGIRVLISFMAEMPRMLYEQAKISNERRQREQNIATLLQQAPYGNPRIVDDHNLVQDLPLLGKVGSLPVTIQPPPKTHLKPFIPLDRRFRILLSALVASGMVTLVGCIYFGGPMVDQGNCAWYYAKQPNLIEAACGKFNAPINIGIAIAVIGLMASGVSAGLLFMRWKVIRITPSD